MPARQRPDQLPADRPPELGWPLVVLSHAYREAVTAVVGSLPHGVRGYLVLSSVVHDDRPSQLALAEHLGIDRTVMTYVVDDLAEAGLVERRPDPEDRRRRRVVATRLGTRTLTGLERRVRVAEAALLRSLEPVERHTLAALLHRAACGTTDVTAAEACGITGGPHPANGRRRSRRAAATGGEVDGAAGG